MYQITCKNIKINNGLSLQPPFSNLTQFYGLDNFLLQRYNVKVIYVTPSENIVSCDIKGRIKIEFFFKLQGLKRFNFFLYSAENNQEVKNSCIYWLNYEENEFQASRLGSVACLAQTPKNGNFVLKCFLSSDNCNNFFLFSSILVSSKLIENKNVFDIPSSGRIGNLSNDHRLSFNFISSDNQPTLPMVKSNSNGEAVLVSKNVFYTIEKIIYDRSLLSDYLINNRKRTFIILRAHQKGFFQVSIRLRNLKSKKEFKMVVYKILIDASNIISTLVRFPSCPLNVWGLVRNSKPPIKILDFKVSNAVHLFENYSYLCDYHIKCCFVYRGGKDMKICFSYEMLKCVMINMTLLQKEVCMDDYTFIPKMCSNSCTVLLRFPKLGIYSIKLYTKNSFTERYILAYIALCYVYAPSSCLQAFPKQFSLWNESIKNLHNVLVRCLDRSMKYKILLQVAKINGKDQAEPYSSVLLVDNTGKVVQPSNATSFKYEWVFYVGLVEQTLSIIALKSTKSDCWSVLLQFDIK